MSERERDRDGSVASFATETGEYGGKGSADASEGDGQRSTVNATDTSQSNIDILFDRIEDQSLWEPSKAPQVLGELLDSRYMLPLHFPSDPRMLAALPGGIPMYVGKVLSPATLEVGGAIRSSSRDGGPMTWRSRNRKVRDVGVNALKWIDGTKSVSSWSRPMIDEEDEEVTTLDEPELHLTRRPSGRGKNRSGIDEDAQTIPAEDKLDLY
jgi:hypothetical protein